MKNKPNKPGLNLASRMIIQLFGSFILGLISAYLVYEEPKPNPGNFMGPLGAIIASGIVFLIVFVISFFVIWLTLKYIITSKE